MEQSLQQADIPIEVMHLLNFMNQSKVSIHEMFKVVSQSSISQDAVISERQFDECCAERGYEPKDQYLEPLYSFLGGSGTAKEEC